MTYYAVTNDPNELMHFGILGMKWGRRRTPEQLGHPRHHGNGRRSSAPRSEAYKKAQSKLGKMMKSGIKKAEAHWREYNSPEAKYERQTNRAIEQARKGKLHYRKLTDDQVRRVTERLALERQARQIADTEKTWKRRLGEAIGTGIITGVGAGVAARTGEWIKRGGELKTERMKEDIKDSYAARSDRRKNRMEINKYKRTVEEAAKSEDLKERLKHKREKDFAEEAAKNEQRQQRLEARNQQREQQVRIRRVNDAQKHLERQQQKQQRLEAKNQRREYREAAKRIEAMQRQEAAREAARQAAAQARLDAAEAARQRSGRLALLGEVNARTERQAREEARETARREAARSRQTTEQGWRDRQERQEYRSRVSQMADDVGSGRSAPFGYNPNANYGTRSTTRTRRRRPGRRN